MKNYKKQHKGFGPSKKIELTEDRLNYLTINDVMGCLSQYTPYLLEESGSDSKIEFHSMVPANTPPGMAEGELLAGSLFFTGDEDLCVMVTYKTEEGLEVHVSPVAPMGVKSETDLSNGLQELLSDFINSSKWAVSTFWTDKNGKRGSACSYTHKKEWAGSKAEDLIPEGATRNGPSPCSEHENLWNVLEFCMKMNSIDPGPGPIYVTEMIKEWGGKMSAEVERVFKVDKKITSFLKKKGYEVVGCGMTPFQPIPMTRNIEVEIDNEEWGISYNSLGKVVGFYKGSYAEGIPDFDSEVPEALKEDLKKWSL